jgi:hypothetical protein
MRKLYLGAVLAGVLALCQSARATVIEVSLNPTTHTASDVNFNDVVGGGNQNVIILEWLKGEITSYNNFVANILPAPTEGLTKSDNLNGVGPTISVEAGDYLVLHYGVGTGGTRGSGGGLVALYFSTAQTYKVPNNGSGPNGFGGISFVDLWDHTSTRRVPDGGATLAMLGLALAGLCWMSHSRKAAII